MERPNLNDYNLTDVTSLACYVSAWNEYSNLLKLEIKELKTKNKELMNRILVHPSETP